MLQFVSAAYFRSGVGLGVLQTLPKLELKIKILITHSI